jgi:hypothetical protein
MELSMNKDDLYEAFFDTRSKLDALNRDDMVYSARNGKHRYSWTADIELCANSFGGQIMEMGGHTGPLIELVMEYARRYIVARDFNILDRKESKMMWKLQNP